jgi:4-hydroxyacetophenone monooxygenase
MTALDAAVPAELLGASDETIADALAYADPMVLRGLLYQLTGDEEIRAIELALVGTGFYQAMAPASEDDVELLRRRAAELLTAYRDAGAAGCGCGPAERLPVSLQLACGLELGEDDVGLYREELALDPWARGLSWQAPPAAERLERFSVVVIGAGMGGLNAALQLKRAGIPFTLIEKNPDVGGTWFENIYPGIRVDSPSRGYTHLFGVGFGYPYAFCPGAENKRYFDWIADTFGLRDDIVFGTEVRSLRWDEESSLWEVAVAGPAGEQVLRSNAVLTAVGFLNRPNLPELDGMAEFRGSSWHTARWPQDFELAGKRLAVIGTGCSGYQLVPELALEAAHVVVCQRTPQWLFPVPGYRSPLPPQILWLERNVPLYANFARFRSSLGIWAFLALAEIDPEFDDPDALNERNRSARDSCIAFLERRLGDPELVAKMTPPHPVLSARPVVVDSDYSVLDAIQRDNVTLVTEGIRRITESGIEAKDGTHYDVDVIVYATGFHATDYLFPMTVTGREGTTIDEVWSDGGARAYLGCMIPGFPNLWTLYGPNTNGGGLPVAANHELVALYALKCIEGLILEDRKSVEVRPDAYWRYNRLIDERNARMAWSDPRARNYYWSDHGRSATMCPLVPTELWRLLRQPNLDELEIA